MKMSKEMLHGLVDMLSDADTETIFKVLLKFIPEDKAVSDEIEAIKKANDEIANGEIVNHKDVDFF